MNMRFDNKRLKIILVVVVVLIGAFLIYKSLNVKNPASPEELAKLFGGGEVAVEKGDLASMTSRLPAGFPVFIPVEEGNMTESYKVDYSSQQLTQYKVSYFSQTDLDSLFKVYSDAFLANGYRREASTTDQSKGILNAFRWQDKVNVTFSQDTIRGTLVSVIYIKPYENK